ncbi:MAG: helix-turn-helix transcriptional regulator [Clostridia bacterium]|nr:helix-turn-helix transcriptional regulator [Clostridia bacterium]
MKKDEIQIFCDNIKILRQHNNLSKTAMCKIMRIGIRSLNSIEKGILPPRISCEALIRACNYFSVLPKDMLSENIKMVDK